MTQFQYMLAPIEDMTSNAFRTICYKYGADLTFTELTRAEGLAKKNKCTWSRFELHDETPTIFQFLGGNEEHFKKALSMFSPHKGFIGFNLNAGCPSPQVVKLGQGCAMMRRISKVKKIISVFRDRGYPISVKMRLGLNHVDKEHKSYLNLLNSVDADFFIIHARYGLQNYTEAADYSVFEECVKTGKKIIANGDIHTKEQVDFLKSVGVNGVMIGRAAILNPSIFNQLKGISSPPINQIIDEYTKLTEKFDEPFKYRKNVLRRMGRNAFGASAENT